MTSKGSDHSPGFRPSTVPAAQNVRPWLPIGGILILALGLYLYQLGTESFWVDELYSIHDARAIPKDIPYVRPVYYLLLYGWMQLGSSDAWLRGLSVIFGLGNVVLIYLLGRRVAGEAVGLISALLLTLSPLFINFAQMTRMYAVGNFWVIGGTLALVTALENPNPVSLASWVILRLLMVLTIPLSAALMAADVLVIVWTFRKQRSQLLTFGKWLLLFGLLWIPFLFNLISQTLPFITGAFDFAAKAEAPTQATHAFPPMDEVIRKVRKFTVFPFPSPSRWVSLFYQGFTLVLWGLVSLALVRKHRTGQVVWMAVWLAVPAVLFFVVSKRLWGDRYLLFLMPYMLIILAAGFMRLWRIQRIAAVIVGILYAIAVSGGLVRYYSVLDRQDWRGLADFLNRAQQPGDVILLTGGFGSDKMATAFSHYYTGDAPIYTGDLCSSSRVPESKIEEDLQQLPASPERLWLLCGSGVTPDQFEALLGDRFTFTHSYEFRNENFYRDNDLMYLYEATPRSTPDSP